jgi:4-hydroxybenzoate polyprenyltransferase
MSKLGNPDRSGSLAPPAIAAAGTEITRSAARVRGYIAIARPDHWVKNIFMMLGVLLAYFYHPELLRLDSIIRIVWAVATTCLLASSNYVLNEILDAPTDLKHPKKRYRPIPSGRISVPLAYVEWIVLGILGLSMAAAMNRQFFFSGALLLFMGIVYNVRPIRSKDLPYVDVLTESINNPIRLLLGWFCLTAAEVPPVSLLLCYWMIGAFLMAAKRFAEYRSIGNAAVTAAYRPSFRYYDETKLLISMFFYTICFAVFLGVFIVRWHLELILFVPLLAGFVSYYLYIAFKPESAAQHPEQLYRETGLMAYMVLCLVVFVLLMLVDIPRLYDFLNQPPSRVAPLWRI